MSPLRRRSSCSRRPRCCSWGTWSRFVEVARWALLAYAITAGLIEFAFLNNDLSGGPLVVLTLSLVVYAVHVPMLIGFTVARYHEPETWNVVADRQ